MKTSILFFVSLITFLVIFGNLTKEAHESEMRWKADQLKALLEG